MLEIWQWLLLPIDSSRLHEINQTLIWHGRLMFFAWGMLVPLGIIAARYFKIMPQQKWPLELDNRCWWYAHLTLQYSALGFSIVALFLVLKDDFMGGSLLHKFTGWTLLVLAVLQILSGLLRGSKGGPTDLAKDGSFRGDHYDMTLRRQIFEYFHKFLGLFLLLLSVVVVISGLWQINSPKWIWISIGGWWSLSSLISVYLQKQKKSYDTYQAIWGDDLDLVGNTLKPIGIGVFRPSEVRRNSVKKHSQIHSKRK